MADLALQPNSSLGTRIRALRRSRGITQAKLGYPLTRSYISLIENDRVLPSLRTLLTIAARLQVEPCALIHAVNLDAKSEYTRAYANNAGAIARST